MEQITLHGRRFDRHPTPTGGRLSEKQRYARLAVALAYARKLCETTDRSLYLSLTRAHADVLAELDRWPTETAAEQITLPWESPEVGR
jgi:hypothetical protein